MKNENNPDLFSKVTTAELMLEFGKSIDEALKIERDLEKIVKKKGKTYKA